MRCLSLISQPSNSRRISPRSLSTATMAATAAAVVAAASSFAPLRRLPPPSPATKPLYLFKIQPLSRSTAKLFAAASSTISPKPPAAGSGEEERVFFDGGSHYGDLVSNLLLGFTLLWLPLTIAAVSRAFFLRYRFTNRRVTVISGFTGQDRSDFPYSSIQDVQVVPRFIGEWGDLVITLKDGTKVDLRSVPKFREIADYCLYMADGSKASEDRRSVSRGF